LEKYYTFSQLRSAPFNVISEPTTFNEDGTPVKVFAEDITQPKLNTFLIFGKHITKVVGHAQHNTKNSPPSKSYQCSMCLDTANPQSSSLEKIPFDYLVKNGCVHEQFWKYVITKGQTALPSNTKCVQKGVSWLHPIFKQEYNKTKQN